jgi:KTSC domain
MSSPHHHQHRENLIPIPKSSTIEGVRYYPENGDLHVAFKSGGHYLYHKVGPHLYRQLMAAESKGKFIHQMIKGKHKVTKLP